MQQPLRRWFLSVWLAFLLAVPAAAIAQPALEWLSTVDETVSRIPGVRGDRARTIAWLAAFNALDAIAPRYVPYAPAPAPVGSGASAPSADAALAAALYTVLVIEPDADHSLLVRRYRESLAAVKSAPEREAGAALGRQAALMLLVARSNDRVERVEPKAAEARAGVFAMPSYAKMPRSIAIVSLAPFGVRSVSAFDPGPPPPLGSAAAARDIAEVRAIGGVASTARSGDQTAAALFWNSGEPSDFTSFVKTTIEPRKLDALDVARLAALDAVISIDSAIVGSSLKERYLHWRPESAIAGPHAAAADADPSWQPLVRVPNSPEYPSGGAIGAGVTEVELPRLYGIAGALEWRNGQTQQTRRWPNPAALADELVSARVWAGAHFQSAVQAGRRVGRQVASEILDRQLLPR